MKKTFLSLAIAVAFMLFISPAHAEKYTVKMVSDWDKGTYYFEPKDITIKSGDTITWEVVKGMHNAVSTNIPKGAKSFESPMLHKKGDTWSHTFNVSGTYDYHCHPHAAFGMVGTIIVDHPSKADEMQGGGHGKHKHGDNMKGMDHSKMNHGKMMEKGVAMGEGVINSVDIDNRTINITHEPISALKWPAMTMDLPVTKKVDLHKIKSGDSVNFYIKLGRDKVYRITKIMTSGHDGHKRMKKMDHGNMDHSKMDHGKMGH